MGDLQRPPDSRKLPGGSPLYIEVIDLPLKNVFYELKNTLLANVYVFSNKYVCYNLVKIFFAMVESLLYPDVLALT